LMFGECAALTAGAHLGHSSRGAAETIGNSIGSRVGGARSFAHQLDRAVSEDVAAPAG